MSVPEDRMTKDNWVIMNLDLQVPASKLAELGTSLGQKTVRAENIATRNEAIAKRMSGAREKLKGVSPPPGMSEKQRARLETHVEAANAALNGEDVDEADRQVGLAQGVHGAVLAELKKKGQIEQAMQKLADPEKASVLQQKRLAGAREKITTALANDLFDDAEKLVGPLQEVHGTVLAELKKKEQIDQAVQKLADPEKASMLQQKRLAGGREKITTALANDLFDDAEKLVGPLQVLHETVLAELKKKEQVEQAVQKLADPEKASVLQQKRLAGAREKITTALANDLFDDAEKLVGPLQVLHETVLAELKKKEQIEQAVQKVTDPEKASVLQQKRLAAAREKITAALASDLFDEAEKLVVPLQQLHEAVLAELKKKEQIEQAMQQITDPPAASVLQQKRLAAAREKITMALADDLFDDAEKLVEPLQKLHETVLVEIEKRKSIETEKNQVTDPEGATGAQIKRLNDLRDQITNALLQDEFEVAEGLIQPLRDERDKIVTEMKAVPVAKLLQSKSRTAMKKITQMGIAQNNAGELLKGTDAYQIIEPYTATLQALNKGEAAAHDKAQEVVARADELAKAFDKAIVEAVDTVEVAQKRLKIQLGAVDLCIEKIERIRKMLYEPRDFADTLVRKWPRELTFPDFSTMTSGDEGTDVDVNLFNAGEKYEAEKKKDCLEANWSDNVLPDYETIREELAEAASTTSKNANKEALKIIQDAIQAQRDEYGTTEERVRNVFLSRDKKNKVDAPTDLTAKELQLIKTIDETSSSKDSVALKADKVTDQFDAKRVTLTDLNEDMVKTSQELDAAPEETDANTRDGLKYELIGEHEGGGLVYARLGDALFAGKEGEDVYKNSMRKGVISSGSTGSDGVKNESGLGGWVVKITIKIAKANRLDNLESPLIKSGNVIRDDKTNALYLNFNEWVKRH